VARRTTRTAYPVQRSDTSTRASPRSSAWSAAPVTRLSQAPDGPTRYETVEEFSDPLVALAGPKRVEEGFRRHAEALKARCEKPTQP